MNVLGFIKEIKWEQISSIFVFSTLMYMTLKRCNNLEISFKNILSENRADMASFAHYQQGIMGIAGRDFKGAYFNFVHAIKHTIDSKNTQNIPSILKMIKEQILPNLTKVDLDMIKKDKDIDIDEAFAHLSKFDKERHFALNMQEVKEVINRLQ